MRGDDWIQKCINGEGPWWMTVGAFFAVFATWMAVTYLVWMV